MFWFGVPSIQVVADSFRLFSILLMIGHLLFTKSCKGLSLKTQFLHLTVYILRSVDLLDPIYPHHGYSTAIKVVTITLGIVVVLLFFKYRTTYEYRKDAFWIESCLITALILSGLYNLSFTAIEISWSFTKFVDALAFLPQLYMHVRYGGAKFFLLAYTTCLAIYKGAYLLKWHRFVLDFPPPHYIRVAGYMQFMTYVLLAMVIVIKCDQEPTEDEIREARKKKMAQVLKNVIVLVPRNNVDGQLAQVHGLKKKQLAPLPIYTVMPSAASSNQAKASSKSNSVKASNLIKVPSVPNLDKVLSAPNVDKVLSDPNVDKVLSAPNPAKVVISDKRPLLKEEKY